MISPRSIRFAPATFILALPLLCALGACPPSSEAPDMTGDWNVLYDDTVLVEIRLGGEFYTEELSAEGGSITIDLQGDYVPFVLDCEAEDLLCPSEVWTEQVSFAHDEHDEYPHRVWMSIPGQICDGEVVPARPEECGPYTANPACEDVCEGHIITTHERKFGLVNQAGSHLGVSLGAGATSNGINCSMLGTSVIEADIITGGVRSADTWTGDALENGEVKIGYAAGCLWNGWGGQDYDIEDSILSATVVLTTGFSAERLGLVR